MPFFVIEIDIIVSSSPFSFQGSDVEKLPEEPSSLSGSSKDVSSDNHQPCTSDNAVPDSVSESQRCMSLYFALCTKVLYYFLL